MVAVVNYELYQILTIMLRVHLLQEIPGQFDTFLHLAYQLHSCHKCITLLHAQHVRFPQRTHLPSPLPLQVQRLLVLRVFEGEFEGAALLLQLENRLQLEIIHLHRLIQVLCSIGKAKELSLVDLQTTNIQLFLLILLLPYQPLLEIVAEGK